MRLKSALLALLWGLLLSAFGETQQFPSSLYQDLHWRMVGPFRGGRNRAATGVPSQPSVFYVAQVNGGVWKTDDYGRTWTPIFDDQPTQSVGAIAVAPSNPNIIYVGSGEGLHRPDLSVGDGIYRSGDGGKTWAHLGLRDGQQIPGLAIDPRDPNRLFAAVLGHPYGPNQERGIFRSTDGGRTWSKVLYQDENTGGSDIQIDPSNPEVIYASLWEVREGPFEDDNMFVGTRGGLFKSTDGGDTWRRLRVGLPSDLAEINVAIAPSDPKRLYAIVGTTQKGMYASGKGLGVYRSDDAGESWIRVNADGRPAMRIGGGDLAVPKVDPKNPEIVYSASIVTLKSSDGGKTWASIRGAPGGDDYQNVWINPNNPDIILVVSDQGAIVTVNGGRTWSSWYNQPTAQLYHAIATNAFPYYVCGAQQESGSVCISSRGNDGQITFREWRPVGVIEYGYVAPDPLDSDIIYGAGRNAVSKFHWSTGQVQDVTPIPVRGKKCRTTRTEPIIFSPVDPRVLYYAANVIFKTSDGGRTWQTISPDLTREHPGIPASIGALGTKDPKTEKQRGAVYALGPSSKDVNTLWAGTDDGQIWLTHDGGNNWINVTPPDFVSWSKVTNIVSSRYDEQTAYASVSRFRIDDLRPYIYRTRDGGKTWQLITSALPSDAPVNTVREDPVRKGLLFSGTEKAVWVSFDEGDHWQSLQLNLPHTSMRDLWVHGDDLIVATHGRGFWILDNISPLRALNSSIASSDTYLFKPATAVRIPRSTNTDTPLPPDEPAAENPPDGAVIDYFLARTAPGPLTLEILDQAGKLVRKFLSTDPPEPTPEQLQKQLIPPCWARIPKVLSTVEGMHRWIWDLHYPAPISTKHEYPIAAVPHATPRGPEGPRVLPGQYIVRLTVNGRTYSAPLTVKLDPRVKAPAEALRLQFDAEMRLASMLSRSSGALLQARSVREQVAKLTPTASGLLAESLRKLNKKVTMLVEGGDEGTHEGPKTLGDVNDNVSALYDAVGRADAPPTAAQTNAIVTTEADLFTLIESWEAIRTTELPAANRVLRHANQLEIRPELKPEQEDDSQMTEE
jgi:photosystem II stability/assembly factor-like uncharacterized protein